MTCVVVRQCGVPAEGRHRLYIRGGEEWASVSARTNWLRSSPQEILVYVSADYYVSLGFLSKVLS